MTSTLKRLFIYAKSENEALENFTTEALAGAVRIDSMPLITAFRSSGVAVPDGAITVRSAHTQVRVDGAGILDLIVVLEAGEQEREIWVEVKCFAPESGNQLSRYRAHIAARPSQFRPLLVALSPRRLPGHQDLPWLPWQALWHAVERTRTRTPAWLDLRRFLEEIGMANRFDSPITAPEAGAQSDAFNLLGKLQSALEPVVAHVTRLAPQLAWPASRKIRKVLADHFCAWGSLTIASTDTYRAGVSFGSYRYDETRESWAGVRVWCKSAKDLAVRRQLVDLATAADLSAEWERSPADDEEAALVVYTRLAAFGSLPELSTWFMTRLDELQVAGVLPAIPTLGAAPAQSTDGGDDEGES